MKMKPYIKFNRFFYLQIAILIFTINSLLYSQNINLNQRLTPDVFKEWDAFIRKNAPSQQAYNVVLEIAKQHYQSGRAIVALEAFYVYENLFPNFAKQIEAEKQALIQVALAQIPDQKTEPLYEKLANTLADSEDGIVTIQLLARKYILNKQFDSAAFIFTNFKPLYPNLSNKIDKIIDILTRKEDSVIVHHLPAPINSPQDEWDPNPTPDGKFFFFSGQRAGTLGGHDVFVSEMENGQWSTPKSLGPPICSEANETIDNVSLDGNTLLLSGNFAGTFGQFDIYSASKTESGWGNLYHFPMPVNSEYQDESGYLTSDGKALIFTSDRPFGSNIFSPYGRYYHGAVNGNMDIYVCLKTENGWSEPINLGPTINTPFAERSAFLHPDGKTLYFSSDGHPGLGKLDVFKSVRLSDTSWTEWSEPVNLGRNINSVDDDWGYKIGISGDSAFFSSRQRDDSFGGLDLYTITLPERYKPQKVATVKGRVIDLKNNPLFASIIWENLKTKENLGNLKSNPKTGEYLIILPLGKNYGFYAEKDGYYPTSGNLDLSKIKKDTTLNLDISLISINEFKEKNVPIQINNLFFDYNQYSLKEESFPELDRLVSFLKQIPNLNISIEGHTDNIGSNSFNFELAKKRANEVKKYLISKGIDPEKLKVESFGSSKPIAPNDTPDNRAKNRRVEIIFLK
jgi:outer membrane protein OmpA-like peptidoglycan-associated protein